MRLLSSWQQYLATADDDGVQIHQYATADIMRRVRGVEAGGADRRTRGTDASPSTSSRDARAAVDAVAAGARLVRPATRGRRRRRPGAGRGRCRVRDARPGGRRPRGARPRPGRSRQADPDPRVDAVRGCVAFERGPIVYCVESADLPGEPGAGGPPLGSRPARRRTVARPDLGGDVVGLRSGAVTAGRADDVPGDPVLRLGEPRASGGMRVWIPRARPTARITGPPARSAPRTSSGARRRGGFANDQRRVRRSRGSGPAAGRGIAGQRRPPG